MGNRSPRIPRLVGVDVRALPLTPMEGFVLSRVDGTASVEDLADLTSLDVADVQRTIEKLVALGAVEWADGTISLPRASMRPGTPSKPIDRRALQSPRPFVRPHVTESQPPTATREPSSPPLKVPPPPGVPRTPVVEGPGPDARGTSARPGPAPLSRPGTVMRVNARERQASSPALSSTPRTNGAGSADGAPPAEAAPPSPPPPAPAPEAAPAEIDLPPERRKRIDELYPVLELVGHYEILGLPPTAELKDIRATYFELSKVFHPDTAFRKNLGPYKARMEAIFARLTEAYEVLGKKKSRAEYDAYLALQGDTRAVEDAIASPPEPASSAPAPASPPPAPAAPASTESAGASPATSSAPAPRAPSDEARRRARELLERRLHGARSISSSPGGARPALGSSAPPVASSAPPRDRGEIVRDLASSLKSAASITGGLDPVSRHLREAQRHEQAGDLAAASRELRAATALAPMREDLRVEHERVSRLLSAQLADKYQQAAEYEEKHKKWGAAAVSWSKVVEGRPDDVEALMRAAIALVEAKGDLHKAQRFAQRACDLRPDDVVPRRTLGRVYAAAGLALNARRELERAALLDPSDQIVKNLLGELKG